MGRQDMKKTLFKSIYIISIWAARFVSNLWSKSNHVWKHWGPKRKRSSLHCESFFLLCTSPEIEPVIFKRTVMNIKLFNNSCKNKFLSKKFRYSGVHCSMFKGRLLVSFSSSDMNSEFNIWKLPFWLVCFKDFWNFLVVGPVFQLQATGYFLPYPFT